MARRFGERLAALVAFNWLGWAADIAAAEPVQVKLGALRLNGNLEIANDRNLAEGVAIVLHGTLGHHGEPPVAALQRNLKALGTFGYMTTGRGNTVYIQYIPRTLSYVRANLAKYPRFDRLRNLLGEWL